MKLNPSYKFALVALLAAQNFLADAQTNNAATQTNSATAVPLDYSAFAKFVADRNIFDPNRVQNVPWRKLPPRPPTPPTPPPPRAPDSFSLVGIIGYGEGKLAGAYAFFDGTSQQYRKTVQLNGGIATFKVADIAADSVTLTTGTNSQTVLKIGDQLHDDGSGHWLTANGNDVRYNTGANGRFGNRNGFGNGNGNGGRGGRQRNNGNNNFGGFNQGNNNGNFNNNGGFNRGRNNFGGATTPAYDNSQAQDQNMGAQDYNNTPDDNMTPPDDNAPPDNNMPPPDFNAPPDQGQQN
jgi:hypothetical protein